MDFSDSDIEDFADAEDRVRLTMEQNNVRFDEAGMNIPDGDLEIFASTGYRVRLYMEHSDIRFDTTISVDSLFGPDRDRLCRQMYEKALWRGEDLNPWNMWKKASRNIVACKFSRLPGNNGFITHECGWWEDVRAIQRRICFCFCHDNLGYTLRDGNQFLICSWRNVKERLQDDWENSGAKLQLVNKLTIDYIYGNPLMYIKYIGKRNGFFLVSDNETGALRPSEILSVQAFAKFLHHYNLFKQRVQIYRATALGQFMTMQSKRHFQRTAKAFWILRDDSTFAIITKLQTMCMHSAKDWPTRVRQYNKRSKLLFT